MAEHLVKLERFDPDDESVPGEEIIWPNVWSRSSTKGVERLEIAPSYNHLDLLKKLVDILPEPFGLLYVLVLSPSESHEPGRYQAEVDLTKENVDQFFKKFADFLECDGRHNLWVRSYDTGSQIIFDRHKVLYAYGDLEAMITVVEEAGLREVDETPQFGFHAHSYYHQFNTDEDLVLEPDFWKWHPLVEEQDV